MTSADSSSSFPDALEAAVRLFVAGQLAGNPPDVDAFCGQHPECGPELRRRLEDLLYVAGGLPEIAEQPGHRAGASATEQATATGAAPGARQPTRGQQRHHAAAEPERFGRFRLLECVGQGGMGAVHLAFDEKLEREVAVKQIRPEHLHSAAARQRFEREARAVSSLDHPNLCKVFEAGQDDGMPYLVMQFLEGETLRSLIEKARRTESVFLRVDGGEVSATTSGPATHVGVMAVVHLAEKVARALHHAHENGLVHRDIKPGNIMVSGDGEPTVLDFGLVREEEGPDLSLTGSRDQLGTPLYMAPEQIVPAGRVVDRRTDVYALGVTLYESLTFSPPFDEPTRHELFEKILRGPVPDPRNINRQIPRDLRVVLETAMEKEMGRRYKTALELAEELRRVRSFEPIRTKRAGLMLRAWRWTQRNRAASVALVTLLLGIVVFAFENARTRRNARLASERADALVERQARFDDLSLVVHLEEARTRAEGFDLAWPAPADAMREWLRVDAVLVGGAGAQIRQTLDGLRASTASHGEEEGWQWKRDADRFLGETLTGILPAVDAFADDVVPGVRRRLGWAEQIDELTLRHPNARATWAEASGAIRKADGVVASGDYANHTLDLERQNGLVPIGMNPRTKLWEFYHLRSAWDPDSGLDPADLAIPMHGPDGSIEVTEDTGIVFVLLPGGTFSMGAQSVNPDEPNYARHAVANESPVHEVTLEPFFLARHELTQAQWLRLRGGDNPSYYEPGSHEVSLAHPVERVTWEACMELMGRHGLGLPTEAQWEYGCRAGSTTPWWTGSERESLIRDGIAANLADQAAAREGVRWPSIRDWTELDDGHVLHAPVGSLRPNPWGLFHVHGNVWEWCRDAFGGYDLPAAPGDGFRQPQESPHHVLRGGGLADRAREARSAYRNYQAPAVRNALLGLRPARARSLERR